MPADAAESQHSESSQHLLPAAIRTTPHFGNVFPFSSFLSLSPSRARCFPSFFPLASPTGKRKRKRRGGRRKQIPGRYVSRSVPGDRNGDFSGKREKGCNTARAPEADRSTAPEHAISFPSVHRRVTLAGPALLAVEAGPMAHVDPSEMLSQRPRQTDRPTDRPTETVLALHLRLTCGVLSIRTVY